MAHGLSCSTACGIFLDQGLNLCLLHWQADSLPLRHQRSPDYLFFFFFLLLFFGHAMQHVGSLVPQVEIESVPFAVEVLES